MKKVLFCIVCLDVVLSCFGQSAKVKLVAQDHKIILFGNERYELEKGETRWVTLEGDPMYGEYLRASENCFLFLEAGDSLEITLKKNGNIEFNDERTLCVARNKWLQKVESLKEKLLLARIAPRLLPEEYRGLNLEKACDSLNVWLDRYLQENPADRKNFEKVMRVEFKYYRLLGELDFKQSKATFFEFPEDVLSRLAETIPEAKDDRVVYAPSYWRAVGLYVDYLRIEDPRGLQGKAIRMYDNELRLAKYFPKGAVRDRVAYSNLEDIVYWVRPDRRKDIDKCVKRLAPRYAGLLRDKLHGQDADRKGKKLLPDDLYPSLTGENVTGEKVDLSSFKGSWILLDVWATWCGPCCNEIPFLGKMEKRLKGRNIEFVSLSVDKLADREKWIGMIREKEMKGVQLRWTGKGRGLHDALCISGIPHFAIIDPTGKVVWNGLPGVSHGQIYRILKELPIR